MKWLSKETPRLFNHGGMALLLKGSFIERKTESRTISSVTTLKEGYLTTKGGHFFLLKKKIILLNEKPEYTNAGSVAEHPIHPSLIILGSSKTVVWCYRSVTLDSSKMLARVIVRIHRHQ